MLMFIQVLGAFLILVAFLAVQVGVLTPDSPFSLGLNLLGSLVLAVVALHDDQWGFLVLEGVWATVSLWSLITGPRKATSPARRTSDLVEKA